jgi:hypothetical protein
MTDCTEVIERLALKDGHWEMTRTYVYADGASKNVVSENEDSYYLVPAAPGWVVATDSYYDDEPVRDHHLICMWKYIIDRRDYCIMPLIPGDNSMTRAVAVLSPDGRVFEVSGKDCLMNHPYPSLKAWHDHVARKRTEHLAEQEKRRLEEEKCKCPACGRHLETDEIPF